uniref:Uncharacterized protein n=1 Tax=Acrobeloides nanus TaxID=290746 RepID=A0A914CPV1_9BILA
MIKNPEFGVSCVIADFLQGNLADIRRIEVIVMGVLMAVVYMVIWAIIKLRKNHNLSSQQKVIKSLTVIMIMVTEHRAAFKKQLKCLSWIPCFRKIVNNHSKANIATINQQIRLRNSVTVTLKTSNL